MLTRGGSAECGAAVIGEQWLISASHCLENFDRCQNPGDCYAQFRKLNKGKYQVGEFRIDLLDAILGPGKSDLALVKLETKVSQHQDYDKGVRLQPVKLATSPPRVGETVYTAGWGRTGFNMGPSNQLKRLQLVANGSDDRYIYTLVRNEAGKITDTCSGMITWYKNVLQNFHKCCTLFAGDSGGPLLVFRNNEYEIVGTLEVRVNSFFRSLITREVVTTARMTPSLGEVASGTTSPA